MSYVIMLNGHPACLKSTISKKLSNKLNIPLVRTNAFGGTIAEDGFSTIELRDKRYQQAFKQAEEFLEKGNSIVFDGTFTRLEWRKQLYSICQKHKIKEVIILRCISSNDNIVKERFMKRALLEEQPEKDSIYFKNYLRDVPLDDAPYSDFWKARKRPAIITFDSGKLEIIYTHNINKHFLEINQIVNECISELVPDELFMPIQKVIADNKM